MSDLGLSFDYVRILDFLCQVLPITIETFFPCTVKTRVTKHTRLNHVNGNTPRKHLLSKYFAVSLYSEFACTIRCLRRKSHTSSYGSHIHDSTFSLAEKRKKQSSYRCHAVLLLLLSSSLSLGLEFYVPNHVHRQHLFVRTFRSPLNRPRRD